MYTSEQFIKEVEDNGGFNALLGMYFNNSNVITFGKGIVFDPATQLDKATGTVKFEMYDIKDKKIITTRKLEYLEGMSFAKDVKERDNIDLRAIRY